MSIQHFFVSALAIIMAAPAQTLLAQASKIDVSRVIDKPVAELILEEAVKVPAPRNAEGSDGYYSKCNYYTASPGKTLVMRVYQAGPGFSPYKELEQVIENSGAMRALSGLGDKARICAGAESGLPPHVVMLYVIKGNALITVGLSGVTDDNVAQEKVRSVAQKIIENL